MLKGSGASLPSLFAFLDFQILIDRGERLRERSLFLEKKLRKKTFLEKVFIGFERTRCSPFCSADAPRICLRQRLAINKRFLGCPIPLSATNRSVEFSGWWSLRTGGSDCYVYAGISSCFLSPARKVLGIVKTFLQEGFDLPRNRTLCNSTHRQTSIFPLS